MDMRLVVALMVGGLLGTHSAQAHDTRVGGERPGIQDLPPVAVPPIRSPPLWLFTRGQKQLILLGTQAPLPESGAVVTDPIQAYIARSQSVLTGPGLDAGDGGSALQGLTALWSFRKAQRNAGGRTLSEILPADVDARWRVLKAEYLGKDAGVEHQRPMYAAYALYTAALARHELTERSALGPLIDRAARSAGMTRVDARFALPVQSLRRTLGAFDVPHDEDVRCLDQTLRTLQAYLDESPAAADAWSVGDLPRYRDAERRYTPIDACWARLTNEAIGRAVGVPAPYARVDDTWYAAIQRSLAVHDRVFSTLPARALVNGSGLAGRLVADGFAMRELVAAPRQVCATTGVASHWPHRRIAGVCPRARHGVDAW